MAHFSGYEMLLWHASAKKEHLTVLTSGKRFFLLQDNRLTIRVRMVKDIRPGRTACRSLEEFF
jgi:hypothetical protein